MGSRRFASTSRIRSNGSGWSKTSTPLIIIRLVGSSIRSQAKSTLDIGTRAGAGS